MGSLRALMQQGKVSPADMRWFLGEAIWSAGQLEQELALGTWAAVDIDREELQPLRHVPCAELSLAL